MDTPPGQEERELYYRMAAESPAERRKIDLVDPLIALVAVLVLQALSLVLFF